jgi:type II secretion system protein G
MSKAFTLIELLVVIAVIGLLSAIVLVSMQGARTSAMISKTKSDLDAFRTALNLYLAAHEVFPCLNEGAVSACLNGALSPYGKLPATDPWGNTYQWHNPGCCFDECTMVLSGGPNGVVCTGTGMGCEHFPSQTSECSMPSTSYDDIGVYFGKVRVHQ